MMLLVLLLLIGYCTVFVLIYIVKVERDSGMLALLFVFESIQVFTCYSLLRILQKISTDMSNTMLAIQIVSPAHQLNSIQSLRDNYMMVMPSYIVNNYNDDISSIFYY